MRHPDASEWETALEKESDSLDKTGTFLNQLIHFHMKGKQLIPNLSLRSRDMQMKQLKAMKSFL